MFRHFKRSSSGLLRDRVNRRCVHVAIPILLMYTAPVDSVCQKAWRWPFKRSKRVTSFISVFNQLDAQNVFHNKFHFMPLHVSSTCAHHQEVKIALHSLWYHHTCRWLSRAQSSLSTYAPDGHLQSVMIPVAIYYNFDLLMMSTWCSKHVEAYNKLIIKQDFVP